VIRTSPQRRVYSNSPYTTKPAQVDQTGAGRRTTRSMKSLHHISQPRATEREGSHAGGRAQRRLPHQPALERLRMSAEELLFAVREFEVARSARVEVERRR
jgi:hypothetical protein